jgi:hypothetical protein
MAGPAASQADPEAASDGARWSRLHVGTVTRWWQQELGLRTFSERPAQVPARNAARVEVGERFWARAAGFYLSAGTQTACEGFEATMAARIGLATLDLHEESRSNSLVNPSSPPVAVVATGTPGAAFGLDGRIAGRPWATGPWGVAAIALDGTRVVFDDAPLFGGPPLEGTALAFRIDATLALEWPLGAWRPYVGGRVVFTTLDVEWKTAVGPPAAASQSEALFWERWPARVVIGLAFDDARIRASFELAIGRWQPVLSLQAAVAIRL